MSVITLTTDFGTADWFVGSIKGVILGIAPQARIVDITHEVPPGDIRAGAFALRAACRCFPRQTVHLAVIDPGVGSGRPAIAVRTADYFFVGPDNGVLSWALAGAKIIETRRVENDLYHRQPVSATFHGRDIFAPVAARLTQGILLDSLGPVTGEIMPLPWPSPKTEGGSLKGEVLCVDRFGNAITNIETAHLSAAAGPAAVVTAGGVSLPLKQYYQEVPAGEPLALVGSTGLLEVAINGGSAAAVLGLKIGDPVTVR